MMDLEKFEKDELPRIRKNVNDCNAYGENHDYEDSYHLLQAFEQAMAALRDERKLIRNIISTKQPLSDFVFEYRKGFYDACAEIANEYEEKIRSGK